MTSYARIQHDGLAGDRAKSGRAAYLRASFGPTASAFRRQIMASWLAAGQTDYELVGGPAHLKTIKLDPLNLPQTIVERVFERVEFVAAAEPSRHALSERYTTAVYEFKRLADADGVEVWRGYVLEGLWS